ncbi:phage head closure protein [Bradyrhizobium sp. STM 3561]|uniref:phage head closure protein n=1 Tax=Bradyrhizobium sp. STM 3561 TaxID=578923 RepID=UPI00388F551E
MQAGTLNKRATFRSLVTTPDGAGGQTQSWLDYITVWAQFSPERARERLQEGRIADNQAGVLRVRSSTATRLINDTYRVVLDEVTYNVRSHANPDQRNDMLEYIVETDGTENGL